MKTFFTFSKKMKTVNLILLSFSFFASTFISNAQVTATEDFENEAAAHDALNPSFSEGSPTINFTTGGSFKFNAVGTYGYANSKNYIYISQPPTNSTTTGTININTALNPGIGFKINSFAAYVAWDGGANLPYNGQVTISGTPIGGSPISTTINISSAGAAGPTGVPGQNRDANGTVFAVTLPSPAWDNLYFTSLTFSIFDADGGGAGQGTRYFEIDHINFTTSAPNNNTYAIGNSSIVEGNAGTSILSYQVNRSLGTAIGTVQIQSSNGTATAGSDYVALPLTTVNFPIGSTSQTVNVTINGDTGIEPNETFNMTLSSPTGGTIATGTGTVTITDDDENAEIFDDEVNNALTFSQNGNTFSTSGKLKVHVGGNFGAGGSTGYALSTEPYASGNQGSFTITSPSKSFYATSVALWSAVVSGTGPNWTYTVTNCTVTFTGTKFDGTGTVTHSAAITPTGSNGHFVVNFAGTPLANVNLSAISFSVPSPITYLQIDNFKYGTTASNAVQVSINDVSVLEGTGGGANLATFTVTRTNNSTSFSVDVNSSDGTANFTSDYSAYPSTILNFTAGGALSQTVSVPIIKDASIEPNETFNMNLFNATNGALYLKQVGLGTILDDDKICETFDTDVHNATTFSENGITFSSTNRFKVVNSGNSNGSGSNTSPGFLIGTNGAVGSMGKMVLTSPNIAFKLSSLDVWTSSNGSTNTNGSVTFIGTLFGGGTVTTTKAIVSNTGNGWHQNVLFTGTPLDIVLLTELEVISLSPITEVDIDNFCYAIFSTVPIIEVTDASNVNIFNGGVASTSNNTDFGAVCTTGGTVSKTFTIKNTGTVNLTLTSAILGGTDAAQFSVSSPPSTPIVPGGSTSFTIVFDPNTSGVKNATYTIPSNDGTNTPFVVNIKGTGNAPTLALGTNTLTQDVTNNTFVNNSCNILGKIEPIAPSPVSGNVTIKSWVEPNASYGFVPRHYEINPAAGAATATANITLYFTQADFDAYNALNTPKLPQNPTDTPNIANIKLRKYAGTSAPNNDGLPGSYSTPATDYTGNIISTIWNGNYWEIKLSTTGFSGFLVSGTATPLPVNLISFTGKSTENGNLLTWKTSSEKNFSHFEIERSSLAPGGRTTSGKFEKIGTKNQNESNNYEFLDISSPIGGGGGYYRLKMIDLDGNYNFSKIISIENSTEKTTVGNFYPNPSQGKTFIEINALEKGTWEIKTFDLTGKLLNSETKFLQKSSNKIEIEKLNQGMNFVRFENGKIFEIRKAIIQ